MTFELLKKEVIDAGLCTHCGTCVGICPSNALKIIDEFGLCIPQLNGKCTGCGLCYEVCPGGIVPFYELNKKLFGRTPSSPLGNYEHIYIGYAMDKQVRKRGASGGIVTALLLNLFRKGLIRGAVVVTSCEDKPWQMKAYVACSEEEILKAAQSKYTLVPVNVVLRDIMKMEGKFAFVGLPCQVHALRKLEACNHSIMKKIKYIIGIYCGNNLQFNATLSLLRKLGVKDLDEIRSLEYRAGDWPGEFRVTLKNGTTYSVKKFYYNYLIPFYIERRCLFCIDLSNELADVSVGDCWMPELERRGGEGWSVIISRTEKGSKIIRDALADGAIFLKRIDEANALRMHSHGLDFKKVGAFARMKIRKMMRRKIPYYGVNSPKISRKRFLVEIWKLLTFKICSYNFVRKVVESYIPLFLLGRIFVTARIVWRKATQKRWN